MLWLSGVVIFPLDQGSQLKNSPSKQRCFGQLPARSYGAINGGHPKMDGLWWKIPSADCAHLWHSFSIAFQMSPSNRNLRRKSTVGHCRDSPNTTTRIPMPLGMGRHFSMTQQRQILLELVGTGWNWMVEKSLQVPTFGRMVSDG